MRLAAEVLHDPVLLRRVELLRRDRAWILRVTDQDGETGLAITGDAHFPLLVRILTDRILPVVWPTDLRNWPETLDEISHWNLNYKYQGLAFHHPQAVLEFAVLDLLGRRTGNSIGELFGPVRRTRFDVYEAFHDRESNLEDLVDQVAARVSEGGFRAVKCKVGGRMGRGEPVPGRSERLPRRLRHRLGDAATLMADANGSYSIDDAVRIGRILEAEGFAWFEEPCPFDHFEDTWRVSCQLRIPLAGGEQECSLHGMGWHLANRAWRVVQPDLFYFGGFCRCLQVAEQAAAHGAMVAPHLSGEGVGSAYLAHFVSVLDTPAPFQEYKGPPPLPVTHADGTPLTAVHGSFRAPSGPGLGVHIDPDWLAGMELVDTREAP